MTRQKTFHILIALSLISFGFFGSLSHIFNIGLVVLLTFYTIADYKNFKVDKARLLLWFLLTGIFYLFFFRSIFSQDINEVLHSLSPMLAIPILGCLIILTGNKGFEIRASTLARFARVAVIVTFIVYLLLMYYPSIYKNAAIGNGARLELLSGNPIPFSIVVLCLSLISFASWNKDSQKEKIQSIICLTLGLYLALYLANSRGTILAFIITTPHIAWFIFRSIGALFIFLIFSILATCLIVKLQLSGIINSDHLFRIMKGIITLTTGEAIDNSSFVRTELWAASFAAILNNPILGYGLPDRFSALLPLLSENFSYRFTHPHNDILAGAISAGLLGGIFSAISIMSPLWAWCFTNRNSSAGMFLGLTFSIIFFTSASFNTIFFNDITAAWLAFSTFLISQIKES